jgi:hypothetical protein
MQLFFKSFDFFLRSTDVFQEEFYVEVKVDRGGDDASFEWEPRFLFVDHSSIKEVDTSTATDVAVLDQSNLVSVERASKLVVVLAFYANPYGYQNNNFEFNSVTYRMRSDEADKFCGILQSRPLVRTRGRGRRRKERGGRGRERERRVEG